MPLFTRRDRIAIAVITALVIAGWGVGYRRARQRDTGYRLIRDAVTVPVEIAAQSSMPTAEAPLDLNTADAVALDALPGIGPVKAAAIVAHRRDHGPFRAVDDLLTVRGIGAVTVDRVRDIVTVESPSAPHDNP